MKGMGVSAILQPLWPQEADAKRPLWPPGTDKKIFNAQSHCALDVHDALSDSIPPSKIIFGVSEGVKIRGSKHSLTHVYTQGQDAPYLSDHYVFFMASCCSPSFLLSFIVGVTGSWNPLSSAQCPQRPGSGDSACEEAVFLTKFAKKVRFMSEYF